MRFIVPAAWLQSVRQCYYSYEKSEYPPVEVHIFLAAQTKFNKKNRIHFARKLSNLVAQRIPPDRSWVSVDNDFNDPEHFPYEFDSFSIARYGHERNYWSIPGSGWMQENFIAELQSAIAKKDSLLPKFNSTCSAHWLLVVIESVSDSTFFEPSKETLDHIYITNFQKVFLLERLKAKCHELRCQSAA